MAMARTPAMPVPAWSSLTRESGPGLVLIHL